MNSNSFPVEFKAFLTANRISLEEYEVEIPRFIRVLGDLNQVQELLKVKLEKHWFKDFYALPRDAKIKSDLMGDLYYGMDVSSAIACSALEISPNDHVLDLCCAPGAKSRYIADLMGEGHGTITGVDISKSRLSIAKNLLRKRKLERFRLFLMDGTQFNVPAPCHLGQKQISKVPNVSSPESDLNFPTPFYATRLVRNQRQFKPDHLYDKVIVDAECTHDGSMMHIQKYAVNGWNGFTEQFLNEERLSKLESLQQGLLQNGYNLCRPGGIVVYSTCSLSTIQNEGIIDWFLAQNPDAKLEPIEDIPAKLIGDVIKSSFGHDLSDCIRFTPSKSKTSGFFVAKFRKY